MYPDLSYLFHDLFGTPYDNWTSIFKTFGLMLALAFLASAYVLRAELIRKEEEGLLKPTKVKPGKPSNPIVQNIINFVVGFVLGFKLLFIFNNFEAFQSDPAGVLLSKKGSLLGGIILGLLYFGITYWLGKKEDKKEERTVIHPYERTGDITIYAAISGLIGARLFSILENLEDFFVDPLGQLFSGSGLTIYGGLILAFFVVYRYVKKNGMPPIHIMDVAALAVIIGYGVGRISCQLSGDGDWGIVNEVAKPAWFFLPDWIWSFDYPHNVAQSGGLIEGCTAKYCHVLEQRVFPTPFYETMASFLIFGVLWILRKRIKIAGMLFFIYLIMQGIERFLIEIIRVNERYEFLGVKLSQAQYISIGIFIIGIAGTIFLYKKHNAKTA